MAALMAASTAGRFHPPLLAAGMVMMVWDVGRVDAAGRGRDGDGKGGDGGNRRGWAVVALVRVHDTGVSGDVTCRGGTV